MASFREVYELTKRMMGDTEGIKWKEGALFPFMTEAYRALQRNMAEAGHQLFIADATLTIPAGMTVVTKLTVPPLPTDLVALWRVKEKSDGTSGKLMEMQKRTGGLPDLDPTERLRYYTYTMNTLKLIGSNRSVAIWIEYERELPDV